MISSARATVSSATVSSATVSSATVSSATVSSATISRVTIAIAALAIPMTACEPSPDVPDSGPPDAGPGYTCDRVTRVDGVIGETVTVVLDTSLTPERPRDMGLACNNPDPALRWAPQEVIEVVVPGSGPLAVELDTAVGVTPLDINTVLQVRRDCRLIPEGPRVPPTCFHDSRGIEWRSRGGVMANGGETLYVLVTAYSSPPPAWMTRESGPIQVDVRVRANTAPLLDVAVVNLMGDDTYIHAFGSDPDRDVRGVSLAFLDSLGRVLDLWGDGAASEDDDVILLDFDFPSEEPDFAQSLIIRPTRYNLANYLRAVGATRARVRVYDAASAPSAALDVPLE
jgi:hypothetical protein